MVDGIAGAVDGRSIWQVARVVTSLPSKHVAHPGQTK